jgi:uncharacterized protein YciI
MNRAASLPDGLTLGEIAEHYRSLPAQWLIRGIYGPGKAALRETAVEAHSALIRARLDQIRFAGPLFASDGVARTGTWFLIDAADRRAADDFIAAEGFNRAGLFGGIEIHRYVEVSPEERWQRDFTADPAKQMYLCELLCRPGASIFQPELHGDQLGYEESTAASFLIRGPMLSDDASRITGTTWIVEVENRGAARALVADSPLADSGACDLPRIDRWKFGGTIG